jgi:hypothetical protein
MRNGERRRIRKSTGTAQFDFARNYFQNKAWTCCKVTVVVNTELINLTDCSLQIL